MIENVTNTKLKDVKTRMIKLKKKYKTVHLKSRGTKNGRMTYIIYY